MCASYRLARLEGQLERLQGTVVARHERVGLIHLSLDVQALFVLQFRVLLPIVDAVQTFQGAFHAFKGALVGLKLLFIALLGFLRPRFLMFVMVILIVWGSVALRIQVINRISLYGNTVYIWFVMPLINYTL